MLGNFEHALAEVDFSNSEIDQLLGQLLYQLLQLRHNLLVEFFQQCLLDRNIRLWCTHGV